MRVPVRLVRSQLARLRRKRQAAAAVPEKAVILGLPLAAAVALALAVPAGLAQAPLHGYERLQELFDRGPAPPPPYILAVVVSPPAPQVSDEADVGTPLAKAHLRGGQETAALYL
jgi:hypothetical protein